MALAYSNQPIYQGSISGNPATFLNDLHALLLAAGWTAATYLTGHVYACASPQGLAVQVRIWDPADSDYASCVAFQWLSSASPYLEGHVHHLRLAAVAVLTGLPLTMEVWVNCCSLFIGRTGITHINEFGQHPWSVCGGVAWASGLVEPTDQCRAQSPPPPETTTELWWSSGADSGVPLFAAATLESFRSGHYCKRFSVCRNGSVSNVTGAIEANALQLGILRPAGYPDGRVAGFADGIKYEDGSPVASDPLLAFDGVWYGQLWDACLLSKPMALEAVETIEDSITGLVTTWINHTSSNPNIFLGPGDDGRLYSLLLLTGAVLGESIENVAY